MATSEPVGSVILNTLFDVASTVVESVYTIIMGSWPGQTFVALYVIGVGYAIITGRTGEKTKDWATSVFLLVIIGGIASNYGLFTEWVIKPVWGMSSSASAAAAGGETGTLTGVLDATENTLGKIMTIIDRVEVPGNIITNGWLYLKVGIVMAILAILACAQYLAVVCLMCVAIFSLLMMFMVGGICLWFASFKETRFIFFTWLKQTLNYAIWLFFIGAVSGIGNKFLSNSAEVLTSWDLERDGVFTGAIGATILLTTLSLYMLLKSADWAAALTGGTASNTGAVGAMLGGMASLAGGAAGSSAGAAGGAAKWAGGKAGNLAMAGAYRAYSALRGIGTK